MNKSIVKTIPQILKDNICTIFNLLNFLIAISLALVGAWKNILFILVILINTIVGIVQEIKAKRQIEKLTLLSLPKVFILKNNKKISISPDDIKKGDILCLESGSVICSDCTIVNGNIEVNESILTGESEPVSKKNGDKLLSGSTVISGKCTAQVICNSEDNFTTKIVEEVKSTKQSGSELLLSMKKVTKITSFLIIPLGILLFLQGYFGRNMPIDITVVSTSAGLLGMLPKGLVLLISIGFATGVINLSKKNVLVRELHSLENLAHCDVICLDKTGTLTQGELTVEKALTSIEENEFKKLLSTYLKYTEDNNSTYIALKKYFKQQEYYNCISTIPFSSDRKYSAIKIDNNKTLLIGAPEKLCKSIPQDITKIMNSGKRVVVVGLCSDEIKIENIDIIGIIIISDKIRKNAKETINYFYSQGLDIKVISGDNPLTVVSIAKSAGIKNYDKYIDMSTVENADIKNIANKYTIFGRVTPKQKKLLVSAIQSKNLKVAMTGDGVNDLLAMRQSDCSIAMGNGSDAAKQTAQLVLLDSDFTVLKDVISEGRRVINNLTKSAGVFFIKTIYSILLCILCLLFNTEFPFIPIQITLIDAVIEAFPAFFMSFEKNDKKVEGKFLNTAVNLALPNAIAVSICCTILFIISRLFNMDSAQISLIMYLTVGAISLLGVIKASLPFNTLRGFLAGASICGFVLAVVIFAGLLQLPSLSPLSLIILPISIITGIGIAWYAKLPKVKLI